MGYALLVTNALMSNVTIALLTSYCRYITVISEAQVLIFKLSENTEIKEIFKM